MIDKFRPSSIKGGRKMYRGRRKNVVFYENAATFIEIFHIHKNVYLLY